MKWFSLLSVVLLMLATLLCASPVAYADDPPDEDSDTVVDVDIDGELKVDIGVSGPCELNVGAKGPAEVSIDVSDEVKLNLEASDESQVFVDEQSLDNSAQKPDKPTGYQESIVPIISGVFPAAGLLAFFLIRRKAKNNINKKDNQLAN